MSWPRRSEQADPADLVQGWPADYWRGYQHPTAQAQLDRALAAVAPRLKAWAYGQAKACPGWLFYGKPGYGKTATGLAVLDLAARMGFTARFTTAERVAAERESTAYNAREGTTSLGLLLDLLTPELLLVDDIGTREYSGPVRALFFDLVRERNSHGRVTLLTTNVPLDTPEGRAAFSRALDARVLSTYQGHAFNSESWGTAEAAARSLRADR